MKSQFNSSGLFNRLIKLCLVFIAVLIYTTSRLIAEEEQKTLLAGDVRLNTPVYKPNFSPATGIYDYDVTWQGIPAAHVRVGVEKNNSVYEIWTEVKTNSFVDIFYTLRYKAEAELALADFSPKSSYFYQKENSRIRKTSIKFLPNGEIHSTRINTDGNKEDYNFNSNNFTLDPFSAAFVARGLDWEQGSLKKFDAFNGKSRYLISMKAIDKVKRKINGKEVDLWVIEPKVKNLTNPKQSKLRQANIYLTADNAREIVEIKSEVFIGSVRTKLEKFSPSFTPQNITRMASNLRNADFSRQKKAD